LFRGLRDEAEEGIAFRVFVLPPLLPLPLRSHSSLNQSLDPDPSRRMKKAREKHGRRDLPLSLSSFLALFFARSREGA
jgi:hypothetical protein